MFQLCRVASPSVRRWLLSRLARVPYVAAPLRQTRHRMPPRKNNLRSSLKPLKKPPLSRPTTPTPVPDQAASIAYIARLLQLMAAPGESTLIIPSPQLARIDTVTSTAAPRDVTLSANITPRGVIPSVESMLSRVPVCRTGTERHCSTREYSAANLSTDSGFPGRNPEPPHGFETTTSLTSI